MRVKVWLGVAVSAVLLWVAVRGVSLDEVLQQLRQVRPVWLVPVIMSIFLRFWLTAIRWQLLLKPVKRVGIHRLFAITMIGFMANNVLPARLGEFVRAYALGRSEALPPSLPFATIVIERIFDGFTLLLFLVGGLSFLRPSRALFWAAGLMCVLYLGILVGLMLLRTGRGMGLLTAALARLPPRLAGPAQRLLESFRAGLDVLSDARALVLTALLSIIIWVVNAAGVEATFRAFALDLPPYASFLLLGVIAVALVLPSAPGYIGPFQAGTVQGLALVGVARDTALSLSIVYHLANYIPITVVGLVYLSALNLTLGELRAAGGKNA
jgi:glycosyltransferase 2 family protein